MPNPLHLWALQNRRAGERRRKPRPVAVPTTIPASDAVFLMLRRMRLPFVVVITTFSACTAGMMLMPGTDGQGHPYRLTLFDAFYQMTITLTTVGYSEVPHAFSYPQRMWLSLSIFLLVVSWAYAIGVFFALIQDVAFQDALAAQRFRRRVRRLTEPFFLIAGFGQAGRTVGTELDMRDRRFVVVDKQEGRIQSIPTAPLHADVAALEGDCMIPAVLGVAGLGLPGCEAVLALTDNDEANLAVVMTATLLRPDVPVLARCTDLRIRARMRIFKPLAVIDPDDRYGDYLALALHKPVVHQLLMWLMDNEQTRLPPLRRDLTAGRWVVFGDGDFAEQVTADLEQAAVAVDWVGQGDDDPDISTAVGLVAGTENDTTNIALAEHARQTNPDAHIIVRQQTSANKALLAALGVESVYVAPELVAREVLARVLTPVFWSFVEQAQQQDDEWAGQLRDWLVKRCGRHTPVRDVLTLVRAQAPAVVEWLEAGRVFTLADLMRDPADRETFLRAWPITIIRGTDLILAPPPETPLAVDDQILLVGTTEGIAAVSEVCFHSAAVEYVATGRHVPSTWLWRRLTAHRRSAPAVS